MTAISKQKSIREKQITRAKNIIENNPDKIKCNNENDPKRFIEQGHCTSDGEAADKTITSLNQEQIDYEAK